MKLTIPLFMIFTLSKFVLEQIGTRQLDNSFKNLCQILKFCQILTAVRILKEKDTQTQINCLDLFSGAGPDLIKFGFVCDNLIAMDQNERMLQEYQDRYQQQKFQYEMEGYKVNLLETIKENLTSDLSKYDFKQQYGIDINLINIQFGINWTFKNQSIFQNFVNFVDKQSAEGCCVMISYLDGARIREMLDNDQPIESFNEKGEALFRITGKYDKKKKPSFQQIINFMIFEEKIGKTYNLDESLVYTEILQEYFGKKGFETVLQGGFTEYKDWDFENLQKTSKMFGKKKKDEFMSFINENQTHYLLGSLYSFIILQKNNQ